jgi:hypothetical protein
VSARARYCIDEFGRGVLVAGHQVAVAIERDRDRRVPHVARERLRVDAGPPGNTPGRASEIRCT